MQEQLMYVESIRGYPYETKERLADEFHCSKGTIRNRVKEIEEEIKKGRYNDYAIIRDGQILLINTIVFIDYLKYRKMLLDKNARKYVPEFKPELVVRTLGWSNRIVVEEDTA